MTDRTGAQPNCLRGCHEVDAEGGQEETVRRGGVAISGRPGG